MKTLKLKKKALISSVAMLIVAMLALGTATYAWFTSDPTARATGLHMETQSSKGLLVLSATEQAKGGSFSHDTILNASAVGETSTTAVSLQPVSFNYDETTFGTGVYKTTALKGNKYDADTAAEVATAGSTDYYKETVRCKVTGGADTSAITLTGVSFDVNENASNVKNAIRVAVAGTDGAIVGTFALDATGNTYLTGTATAGAGSVAGVTSAGEYTQTTKGSAVSLNAGTADAAGNSTITVYVYLDGQDTDCYSDIVTADELISNVQVALTV